MQICDPISFIQFLQGGTLGGVKWILPNQFGNLSICGMYGCSCLTSHIFCQVLGWGVNKSSTEVFFLGVQVPGTSGYVMANGGT